MWEPFDFLLNHDFFNPYHVRVTDNFIIYFILNVNMIKLLLI